MATAESYAQWIVNNADKKGTPEFETVAKAYRLAKAQDAPKTPEPRYDPTEGMSGVEKFAAGAGKAVYDTGRGLYQIAAPVMDFVSPRQQTLSGLITGQKPESRAEEAARELRESRQRDSALMDTGAGFAGNIVGNVGMALAPGGLIKGAGMALKSDAASALGSTLLAPKTIPSGLVVGGTQGVIQPAENLGERVLNTTIGAGATSVLPVLRATNEAIKPLHDSGRQQILGKLLKRVAGDDATTAAANLRNAKEIVPGSVPTAGQAANNAGIAALERASFASEPTVTNAVSKRLSDQNAARVDALRTIGGTDAQRSAAESARESAAEPLYTAAKGAVVAGDSDLNALLMRPSVKSAWARAQKLAQEKGERLVAGKDMPAEISILGREVSPAQQSQYSGKGLHYLKMALDDIIDRPAESGIGKNELGAILQTKKELVNWIGNKIPEYSEGMSKYGELSRPLNQMDAARYIAEKSIRPIDETITPNAYARALSDDSVSRATGFRNATLDNTFEPAQINSLNNIKDDLERALFAQNAGRGVGSDTVQKIAYNNLAQESGLRGLPNLLSRPVQMLEYGSRMLYGSSDKEMRRMLANALLDPQAAAGMMDAATPTARQQLIADIVRYGMGAAALPAPALVNAQKQ